MPITSFEISREYNIDPDNVHSIGRYQIICQLGQGATGIVYLVWDPFIRRNAALKVAKTENDKFRENFLTEAQSAGRLSHPNIVAVYDAGSEDDLCYIAMEYIKGATLENYCRKENLLPPNRGLQVILDVCRGLEYAHREGVIHRDIKPSNILLNVDASAKITDFGVAQMTDRTFTTSIRGTPHYLSPEQVKDEIVTFQSDIFSLGCVLYEILVGQKAFPGENSYGVLYKITSSEPPSILSIRGDLPKVLEEIVKRSLRKNPGERYRSCSEMVGDLEVALRGMSANPRNPEKNKDVMGYFHQLSFFSEFEKEQLNELAALASIVKVPAGRVVASEGEIDDTFYIILSGQVKVCKGNKDIATIGTGECFGEMAFIGGQPRVANVAAETDCMLMKITAGLLQKLPDSIALLFFRNFARTLVQRLSKNLEERH
ncbi:MAG: cyclic nucleotide-binding protein [Desulfobacteraceae bacterium]|nr:MAG: cyclic nucleotide-binding protein [Desulfobacteraceae bacterium]